MKKANTIPVTILTGFLGAGKTTLLNHLIHQPHGYKVALIINEFGSVSIDHQLVLGADEEIVELSNGCICCRVRGDLIKSLNGLFQKQKRFDYVLVETTGLADPGPVAQTFFLPELQEKLHLDAIVTVIDARHIEKELDDAPEASSQIAFADVLLLNKTDLVTPHDLGHIESRLRRMNPLATIHRTQRSEIEVSRVLGINARDVKKALEVVPPKMQAGADHEHGPGCGCGDHDHDHAHHHHEHDHDTHDHVHGPDCDHDHDHHHARPIHDDRVRSFALVDERPLDLKKTEEWLGELLAEHGADIYRSKGILHIKGQGKRVVFQGVQMMFEAQPERLWAQGEPRKNQLVFIGRDLDEAAIRSGFESCIAT